MRRVKRIPTHVYTMLDRFLDAKIHHNLEEFASIVGYKSFYHDAEYHQLARDSSAFQYTNFNTNNPIIMFKLFVLLAMVAFAAAAPAPSPLLTPVLNSGYALSPALPLASSGQAIVRNYNALATAPLAYAAPLPYNAYAYAPAYYL